MLFKDTKQLMLHGICNILLSFFVTRDKVFRLKPVLDEHVTLIKELAQSIEVPCCLLLHRIMLSSLTTGV